MKLKTLSLETVTVGTLVDQEEIYPLSESIVDDYLSDLTITRRSYRLSACFDGNGYWLFDGYHRFEAMKRLGFNTCEVQIFKGSRRDALRRYIKDKLSCRGRESLRVFKHCIKTIRNDHEWMEMSSKRLSLLFDRKPTFFEHLKEMEPGQQSLGVFRLSINKHGTFNLTRG
jgi:hypothetical protein